MSYFIRPYKTRKIRLWISILIIIILCSSSPLGCSPISPIIQSQNLSATLPFTPTAQPIDDNLGNLVRGLEKTMPKANSEGFIIPGKDDMQSFHNMIIAIEGANSDLAAKLALANNYELLILPDQKDFGAESYILHEQQPIKKGWGLYFFRIRSSQNIVVEAPHPIADEYTQDVALDLYRTLQAKALLISGAHRNANADGSADGAHASESIFQTVHTAFFQLNGQPNTKTIFLQIHGYATNGHLNYPQVVIGYNWKNDPEKDLLLTKIANALQNNNISVGICNGKNYQDLCGTTNIQRMATNGGIFIHLELSESLRMQDSTLVTSLRQAIIP
jgi:hypothetical protein